HPFVASAQASLLGEAGAKAGLAEAAERAARAARTPEQQLAHWYVAAQAWELDENPEHALAAYRECAERDVTHGEVFPRMRVLLEERGDDDGLAKLLQQRLAAGADGDTLVALHEAYASLRKRLGDLDGARESLQGALAIAPDRRDALKELADLSLRVGAYADAADALIKFARLTRERGELRWVFFTLGDIYDKHLPDPKRADAAFKRVLKLLPRDREALERLALLYEREAQWDAAAGALGRLVALATDDEDRRALVLRLAEAHEQRGDHRAAERVLDEERRTDPTEAEVIGALAELYERQSATAALSMHLGRATSDLRRAIEEAPRDPEHWAALVDVLERRGRPDAARVAASAAAAFGAAGPTLEERLASDGGVPGAAAATMDPEVVRALCPPSITAPTLELFRLVGDALDKVVPFDAKGVGARKAPRDHVIRGRARALAPAFQSAEPQVLLGPVPAFFPVLASPPTLLVGQETGGMSEGAQRFLVARALGLLALRLEAVLRTDPGVLGLALAGIVRSVDPGFAPARFDEGRLEDAGKRMMRAVPRRHRSALGPIAIEVVAPPEFDPERLAGDVRRLGDRLGLLHGGRIADALDARLVLQGLPAGTPEDRAAGLSRADEARELLEFTLDDLHFDARRRSGADRL
ncbi:MAG: hypothetical protein AAGH15_19300, partial [Myxococcota bacterium]